MNGYKKTILNNGLRVVTEMVPHVRSASLGIWVNVGGRDEDTAQSGISHFLEHMMFKGTSKRSARDIAEALDDVGGQLNAFTDKEYTCYYAKVLGEDLPLAFDVVSNMLTDSLFNPVELEREKSVVLEEIKRHEDDPEELIHDLYTSNLWPDHALGRSVIGTWESVSNLQQNNLFQFVKTHYTPNQIIVSVAGQVDHDKLVSIVDSAFGKMTGSYAHSDKPLPVASYGSHYVTKETEQVQFCLGTPGFSQHEPDRFKLAVLDTLLGGGMSSRLFQEVREKRGLVYSVGSYSSSFRDAGLFAIYAGTSLDKLDQVLSVIHSEIENLTKNTVSESELIRAKSQLRGAMYLALENTTNRMTRLGKSEIYHGRFISTDEVMEQVDAVSVSDIQSIAARMFENGVSYSAVGPAETKQKP